MDIHEEINALLEEIRAENNAYKNAEGPEEQVEALKDMLDVFMQGAHKVREKIDTFNDRRWQR